MLKIPHSVTQYFESLQERYSDLERVVAAIVDQNIRNQNWLFLHRIKSRESFYFKLQTGRLKEAQEDFLACTIVVENAQRILDAEKALTNYFTLCERRPMRKELTYNDPERFAFDDLRLYLKLKDRDCRDAQELDGLVFEFQVKTFLQHAWSIATHDLIYKPVAGTDWAMARVAFQIKAMLEHAEVSIEQAGGIAKSNILDKENKRTTLLKDVEQKLKEHWKDGLGLHVRRLAENILRLSVLFKCSIDDIFGWIEIDTANKRGASLVSYSPYEVALEAIIGHLPDARDKISEQLKQKQNIKVFVPDEFTQNHDEFSKIFFDVSSLKHEKC